MGPFENLLTLDKRIESAAFGAGELHFENFRGPFERLDHVGRIRKNEFGHTSGGLWNRSATVPAEAVEPKFRNGSPGVEASDGEICPGLLDASGQQF
jgi:hypothetical protein